VTAETGDDTGRPREALRLTAGDIAAMVRGRLAAGEARAPIAGFSIDSRTLRRGDLFFALRGDRFDGHRFVGEALAAGAAGAVVSAPVAIGDGIRIDVADTTGALQALGRRVRQRSGARVVAITGSAGKTTTKEAAAAFLSLEYRVFRNKGNLNNHIGVPLSLLELRDRPDVAVVELGMNHVGEISRLVEIAEPEVRVWTNVAEVHSAFFPSLEAIADAKAEILERASPDSVLVANGDDPLVMARVRAFPGRVITFGTTDGSVRAVSIESHGLEGVSVEVQAPAGRVPMRLPLLGDANVSNVLAATAVALHFDVPLAAIARRAATLTTAAHRGDVVRLARDVVVLDDSYNANPRALQAMLDVIAVETRRRRTIAVVGEMLELGERGLALHDECGRAVAEAGVQLLVTVGGEPAARLGRAAIAEGMPEDAVAHVATSAEAAERVVQMVRPGDLVFVKGSRGIHTDLVVERLKVECA
jgi:UDP-N-acetylmuramoyl-tripeptide--D-alanyl-D-alanine ligase